MAVTGFDLAAYERRLGSWEFHRTEERNSSRRRLLSCGHEIDAREPYVYSVGKVFGTDGLQQAAECDVCQRATNRY